MKSKLKKEFIIILLLLIVLIIIIIAAPKIPPKRHIELGIWTQGLFDPSSQKLHPEKLLQFEKLVDKKVAIAHYYLGWEALAKPSLITQFNTLRSNGWTPMLNVNPYYFKECPPSDLPLYKAIARGQCDVFLHKAGKNLNKIKKPFYLLFAWEMNNQRNTWSIPYTGSSPADFIAAWRHIHNIFKQEKASNVIWVFCPNIPDVPKFRYNKIYPGNAYVDWVGLDGYNWGTTQSWSQWISFSGVFTGSYKSLTAVAPDKPMMIAEVNTTDRGGDKGAWYKDMFEKEIPYNFPKIKAVVIFNEDRSRQEKVNWKVDVTPRILRDFISAIHSGFY